MHLREKVTQPSDPSYRIIPLTQKQVALVDTQDYDEISQFNWAAWWNPCTKSFYAVRHAPRSEGRRTIYMHREIALAGDGMNVDHRDHDTLNNRRWNLRQATKSQNGMNSKLRQASTSGITGVSWHKEKRRWRAHITLNQKMIHVGYFTSIDEAREARESAARKYHGEFAYAGSIPSQTQP